MDEQSRVKIKQIGPENTKTLQEFQWKQNDVFFLSAGIQKPFMCLNEEAWANFLYYTLSKQFQQQFTGLDDYQRKNLLNLHPLNLNSWETVLGWLSKFYQQVMMSLEVGGCFI